MAGSESEEFTLVTRKPSFGLQTACPTCLPIFIYLKIARFPFQQAINSKFPNSDHIPYLESGTYVAFNNERGGVIRRLEEDGIVNLDSEFRSVPEWVSTKAMIQSWLDDALLFELWLVSGKSIVHDIYYSDLPWVIAKPLSMKQARAIREALRITKENAERREEEIYGLAETAYGALTTLLGDQSFLFGNRPSSLDAFFLGHLLFVTEVLPESSILRSNALAHANFIRYTRHLRSVFLESGTSSPISRPIRDLSSGARPKRKEKKEEAEEEKKFKMKAKYFLAAQALAILVFVSVMGSYDFSVEYEDDDNFEFD